MRILTTRHSRITWLSLTVLAAFFLFIELSHGHPSYGGNSDSKPKAAKPPKGPKGGEPSAPPPAAGPSKGKKVAFKKTIDRLPKFELPKEPLVTYRGARPRSH